ncbi:LexA family transcriptional regulator [Herbaspirillum sp. YR522]|uniref:XRE family transcriptional regulator n=1 Tax=Herbaspirillum sp. YR522 TaxID=1144342 RepID=UPI00058B9EA4|nr:LexA family transcriptional regulator [Herbaspirillum sp. YR522]
MEFKNRLQQLLQAKDGGNMSELAAFCKVTPQAVQQWIAQGRAPRPHRLQEIAAYFGITEKELLFGEDVPGDMTSRENERVVFPASFIPVAAYEPGDDDFVTIKTVRLKLSAGITGFSIEPERGEGMPIVFQREWMERNGFYAENLIAVKIRGDSMRPKLDDGDLVVINTADRIPKDNHLYAVNFDGEDVIKRLCRENREWWLVSDNPDQKSYPKQICKGGSCIIIGHIIHMQSRTF